MAQVFSTMISASAGSVTKSQRVDGLAPLDVQILYFFSKFPLAGHVAVRQDNVFPFQKYLLRPANAARRFLIKILYHIPNRNTRKQERKMTKKED